MIKKRLLLILCSLAILSLAGCNAISDSDAPLPTVIDKITETPVPTSEPTIPLTETPEAPAPTTHIHTWTSNKVNATCKEVEHTWEECTCGEIRNDAYGAEYTHGELIEEILTAATEENEGTYQKVCTLCGVVVEAGTIPTLTHEHLFELRTIEVSCSEDGKTWEECRCGMIQNETITKKSTGHSNITYHVIKDASFTEEGLYENRCGICGIVVDSGALAILVPTTTPTPTPIEEVEVPQLVGMLSSRAVDTLTSLSLGIGFSFIYCDEPENIVIGQNIQAGTMVEKDTTIYMTVSLGKEPVATATPTPTEAPTVQESNVSEVPYLVGMKLENAEKELNKLNLKISTSGVYNDEYSAGIVTYQNIEAGTFVYHGEVIIVEYSLGAKPTPKPLPTATPIPIPEAEVVETKNVGGGVKEKTYSDGTVIRYDANNEIISLKYTDGTKITIDNGITYTFKYDSEGNLIEDWYIKVVEMPKDVFELIPYEPFEYNNFTFYFCIYVNYETGEKYKYIVNSDGSKNKLSDKKLHHTMGVMYTGDGVEFYDINGNPIFIKYSDFPLYDY